MKFEVEKNVTLEELMDETKNSGLIFTVEDGKVYCEVEEDF